MATPTLTSISPSTATPGTVIVCAGSGFDPGARAGAPAFVPTTVTDATELSFECPSMKGAPGSRVQVAVWVQNEDGSVSGTQILTVAVAADAAQAWTTIEQVAGEIPSFKRSTNIPDGKIQTWIVSAAQEIAAAMMRRGLPLDPAKWQQPDTTGAPAPSAVLEAMNRKGAAARLARTIGASFGGNWEFAAAMERDYRAEIKRLDDGMYDVFFRPAAAVVESGPQLAVGDMTDEDGNVERSFSKRMVF